jgi:hypothetical protein
MFVISLSVCPWQAFQPSIMFESKLAFEVLHSWVCSWLYSEALDEAGIALAKDKQSSLLRTFVNYGHKKFYNIGPWPWCLVVEAPLQ